MKIFLLISALLLFETSVFANDNFWKQSYKVTNMDILSQRIEFLINENHRNSQTNADEKFFYDCRIICDNEKYYLDFLVWKNDPTCNDSEIVERLLNTYAKYILLKEPDFKKNIKVKIELFGGSNGDDLIKVLYDGFVK